MWKSGASAPRKAFAIEAGFSLDAPKDNAICSRGYQPRKRPRSSTLGTAHVSERPKIR